MPPTEPPAPDRDDRLEILTLVAAAALLMILAITRRVFIGDGIRFLPAVVRGEAPAFGEPRWLLFPPLIWAIVRPFVAMGWVNTVEAAIRPFVATSVLTGIVYLVSLRVWLRAAGCDAATRTAAIAIAAVSVPFLQLYSDIAEVQLGAVLVVAALAVAQGRCRKGTCSSAFAIAIVAVVASAAFVYQALIVGLAFVPLVVPWAVLRRSAVLAGAAVVIALVPVVLIGARVSAGDSVAAALSSATRGESNEAIRTMMGTPTPLKMGVALVAGPPQAIVGLEDFGGLRAMAAGLHDPNTFARTSANFVRLGIGAALCLVLVVRLVQRRDWWLAAAFAAVMVVPMIRNNQYAYVKFYALWPGLLALASTRFDRRHVLAAAALMFALNGSLVADEISRGRRASAEMVAIYAGADANTCFFTTRWTPPFPERWPGIVATIIGNLGVGTAPDVQSRALVHSLERCFCTTSAVLTDTTVESSSAITFLMEQFAFSAVELHDLLVPPSELTLLGTDPARIYAYPPDRQAGMCRVIRR